MTTSNYLRIPPVNTPVLIKRMAIGAGLGLLVISYFLLNVDDAHPYWGRFWMVQPLIVTPMAGAGAGFLSYFIDALRRQGGWKKVLGIVLTVMVFFIALWMGIVLGLHGTMWN